jgi:uncharacterized protein (DUF3084 family)
VAPTKAKTKPKLRELEEEREKAFQEWQLVRNELAQIHESLNEAIQQDAESILSANGDEVDYFSDEEVSPNVAAAGKRFKNLPIIEWSRHIRYLEADHAFREAKGAALDKRIEPLGRAIEEKREELRKLEEEIRRMHDEHAGMLQERRELELGKHDHAELANLQANPPADSIFGLVRTLQSG